MHPFSSRSPDHWVERHREFLYLRIMTEPIDSLEFTRYRCFRDHQKMQFGRLTLVYGVNNSGKSALIRLPALLADSQQNNVCGFNSSSEVLRGAGTRSVGWRGAVADGEDPDLGIKLKFSSGVSWEWILRWKDLDRRLNIESLTVALPEGRSSEFIDPEGFNGMLPADPPEHLATPLTEIRQLFDRTCWLSTNRIGPSFLGAHMGQTGRLWADGALAEAKVLNSNNSRKRVSQFYEKHVKQRIVQVSRGEDVQALALEPTEEARHSSSFKESGAGLECIFPILVAAESLRSKGGLLIVEEPETHLHPKLQQALAEHLVGILKAQPKAQMLMETHSEVFLLAAMHAAMPTGALSPAEVAIYWTEIASDGAAIVEHVPLDELGRANTPRLEQAFATMGAMRRNILRERRGNAD